MKERTEDDRKSLFQTKEKKGDFFLVELTLKASDNIGSIKNNYTFIVRLGRCLSNV